MSHFRTFSYNFEKYSLKDMVNYLYEKGYLTQFQPDQHGMVIENTEITLRPPLIDDVLRTNFLKLYNLSATVHWATQNQRYFTPLAIQNGTYDERTDSFFKDEKIFLDLKRKFAIKKGEEAKAIKDLVWLRANLPSNY